MEISRKNYGFFVVFFSLKNLIFNQENERFFSSAKSLLAPSFNTLTGVVSPFLPLISSLESTLAGPTINGEMIFSSNPAFLFSESTTKRGLDMIGIELLLGEAHVFGKAWNTAHNQ